MLGPDDPRRHAADPSTDDAASADHAADPSTDDVASSGHAASNPPSPSTPPPRSDGNGETARPNPKDWHVGMVRGPWPATDADPALRPIRREAGLSRANRLAVQVRRDALLAELADLDSTIAEHAARRLGLLRDIEHERERLYPKLSWVKGRRPPPVGEEPLPPTAEQPRPANGDLLRSICRGLLVRYGTLSLRQMHGLLHAHGYVLTGSAPVKMLADSVRYEMLRGRAVRVERGVYGPTDTTATAPCRGLDLPPVPGGDPGSDPDRDPPGPRSASPPDQPPDQTPDPPSWGEVDPLEHEGERLATGPDDPERPGPAANPIDLDALMADVARRRFGPAYDATPPSTAQPSSTAAPPPDASPDTPPPDTPPPDTPTTSPASADATEAPRPAAPAPQEDRPDDYRPTPRLRPREANRGQSVKTTWFRLGLVMAVVLTGMAVGPAAAPAVTEPSDLRINQIQVVGSHNSYKIQASPEESAIRRQFIGDGEDLMLYNHAPLVEQFESQAVRQIELDVFRDDEGGKYSEPLLRAVAGHGPHDPAMDEPGTKVLHIQDVDYRSTCLALVDCLADIEEWSDANPDHLPLAVLVELKDTPLVIGDIEFTTPDPWNSAAMDALDEEILGVVPREEIITPDDVRGGHATLEEAVTTDGWPTVDESRGKVMFLMDNGGGYRSDYLDGHPTLEGRVMFTNSNPGSPDAAFVKRNEPRGNVAAIQDLVETGYVVRTRADADTVEARTGDFTGRDAAFESGAQWVSTDYPVPEYAEPFGTGYVVQIPGDGVARCNPVNAPEGCVDLSIEDLTTPDARLYVDFLYGLFLGRTAGPVERDHWAPLVAAPSTRSRAVASIARSREAARGHLLDSAYERILGRGADAASRDFWADRVAAGWTMGRVEVGLAASAEALSRAGGTDGAWIDRLYLTGLGRPADAAGRTWFLDALSAGATRSTVARSVLFSPEGRGRRVADATAQTLGRGPTPGETSTLVAWLGTNLDTVGLVADLAATSEAYLRVTTPE